MKNHISTGKNMFRFKFIKTIGFLSIKIVNKDNMTSMASKFSNRRNISGKNIKNQILEGGHMSVNGEIESHMVFFSKEDALTFYL